VFTLRHSPFGRCRLIGVLLVLSILPGASAPVAADLTLSTDTARQGQTVEVFLNLPEQGADGQEEPLVEAYGHSFKAFPVESPGKPGSHFRALIAIPADLAPATYTIKAGPDARKIEVVAGKFPLQRIRLPKGKDTFEASPGEEEAVDKAKSTLSSLRMWHEQFDKPSAARISTVFGVRRIVNGKLLPDYFHSGLDFAAPLGSPVKACAPGRVALVGRNWKLHGNVVAIDHGQGVVSFYIHLQKALVTNGQPVKAGQAIGLVGQTGRANGPHLHFSLYVNQVAANPSDWFRQVY